MINQLLDRRYKVISHLGSGGFGTTFLAQDTKRPGSPFCVVKQLTPAKNTENFLTLSRRLFQTEAETLECLGKHPQIPQLLAYFEEDEEFYLVQEYINGHSLRQELPIGKKWDEIQVIGLAQDILTILQFVHDNKTIHRDVKPDNIIRRQTDNRLVLVDFGAVKTVRNPDAISSTVALGTPGYIASEQAIGKPRPSSDIYALGIIAIQALSGLSPSPSLENTNTGFSYDESTGEILWLDKVDIHEELADIITRMVKPNFPDRYKAATEVLQDLSRFSLEHYGDIVPTEPLRFVDSNYYEISTVSPTGSGVHQPPSLPTTRAVGTTSPQSPKPFSPTQNLTTKLPPPAIQTTLTGSANSIVDSNITQYPSTSTSTASQAAESILTQAPETTFSNQKTSDKTKAKLPQTLMLIFFSTSLAGLVGLVLWQRFITSTPSEAPPKIVPTSTSSPVVTVTPSPTPTPTSISTPTPIATSTPDPVKVDPPIPQPRSTEPPVTISTPTPVPVSTPIPVPTSVPISTPVPAPTPVPVSTPVPAPLPTVPGGIEGTPLPP